MHMALVLLLLVSYPDSAHFVARARDGNALGLAQVRVSARDVSGVLHVVYSKQWLHTPGCSSDVYHLCSTDNGFTWSPEFNVSATDYPMSAYPSLAADRRGRTHCTWHEEIQGSYPENDIFYRRRDSTGWGEVIRVSYQRSRTNACHYNSIACDSLGRVHLVWDAPPSLTEWAEIWYSIGDDTSWTTPENLSHSVYDDDAAPVVTMDRFDNICLTWTRREAQDHGYCRFKRNGVWLPEHMIDTLLETGAARVASDNEGNFHAVWGRGYIRPSDTLAILYYASYDTVWSEPVMVTDSVHGFRLGPFSMTADSAGNVYVVWPQRFLTPQGRWQRDICYRTFNGREWSEITNLTQDTVDSWSPHLGYPVSSEGVDLFWVSKVPGAPNPPPYDVMYMKLSLVVSGLAEKGKAGASARPSQPTIVHKVLFLPEAVGGERSAASAMLLDITGRKVGDLKPGANDVRYLGPGIYFVRQNEAHKTIKVVVCR